MPYCHILIFSRRGHCVNLLPAYTGQARTNVRAFLFPVLILRIFLICRFSAFPASKARKVIAFLQPMRHLAIIVQLLQAASICRRRKRCQANVSAASIALRPRVQRQRRLAFIRTAWGSKRYNGQKPVAVNWRTPWLSRDRASCSLTVIGNDQRRSPPKPPPMAFTVWFNWCAQRKASSDINMTTYIIADAKILRALRLPCSPT